MSEKSAPVVNSSLVDDPSVQQPGFDLPSRSLLGTPELLPDQPNLLRILSKWGLAATDVPLWQLPVDVTLSTAAHSRRWRGLQWLHSADDVAAKWLKTCGL